MPIILGEGAFIVGAKTVALTRGGGNFNIERVYKPVAADGDMGPVKGRIRKDMSVAKLTMRQLDIIIDDMSTMYPAMDVDTTTTPGTTVVTGAEDIVDNDYNDTVKWVGEDDSGKALTIELENAINLENINWDLIDKDEVIAELIYTATYLPAERKKEPWSVTYV